MKDKLLHVDEDEMYAELDAPHVELDAPYNELDAPHVELDTPYNELEEEDEFNAVVGNDSKEESE